MSKRLKGYILISVISGVLILSLIFAWVIVSNGRVTDMPSQQSDTAQTKSPLFTPENLILIENSVNSQDKAIQAKMLIPILRQGDWSADQLLPSGTTVVINRESFNVDEQGYATVSANTTGSVNAQFIVSLMYVQAEGKWLVMGTERV